MIQTEEVTQSLLPAVITSNVTGQEVAELIAAFLSGRNEQTTSAYRTDLDSFTAFLEVENIDEAARVLLGSGPGRANATALRYKAELMRIGLAPATVNRRLAALRSLVKLARTLGMVPWELEVANCKSESYRDTKGPGRPAFLRLLDLVKAGRNRRKSTRDYLVLRLLYDLALRRGELVRLDLEDVNLEDATIAVLGKGRTEKSPLSLPGLTLDALKAWIEIRGTDPGPLFTNFDRARKGGGRLTATSVYQLVRGLGERIGVKSRPHGLRHTSITSAIIAARENGLGLEQVCDFSRHRDIKTVLVYNDRIENAQKRLAELVAAG